MSLVFVTVVVEPLTTRIVPVHDVNIFNNFNCVVWSYVMYISSSVSFKDQL
jgi:hypothetical protein